MSHLNNPFIFTETLLTEILNELTLHNSYWPHPLLILEVLSNYLLSYLHMKTSFAGTGMMITHKFLVLHMQA